MCWVNKTDREGVVEAHAVAAPQYHGRWLTRGVLRQLDYIIDHTACTRMVAQITSPLTARLWRKLGFTITDDFAYKDITNGLR